MTGTIAHHAPAESGVPPNQRSGWFRPSFILVKYTFFGYLQCVAVTYVCILCVALAADFTANLRDVVDAAPGEGFLSVAGWMVYYTGLRLPDMTGNFLGVVTFLGVLWWEMMQSKSGQRVAAWNGGLSPARSLVAVLLLGGLLGGVQYMCDTWLRPMAIEQQMETGLGKLGRRYDVRVSSAPKWLVAGNDILNARVDYGSPGALYDLKLFRLEESGRLLRILQAEKAEQTERAGYWRVEGAVWADVVQEAIVVQDGEEADASARDRPPTGVRGDSELVYIDFDPAKSKFQHVQSEYLSPNRMKALIADGEPLYLLDDYETRLQYHFAHAFYPGLMAALAATAAIFTIGKMTPIYTYVLIVLSGYFGHAFMKISVSLGELGYMPTSFAAWVGALSIALLAALLQFRVALRTFGA